MISFFKEYFELSYIYTMIQTGQQGELQPTQSATEVSSDSVHSDWGRFFNDDERQKHETGAGVGLGFWQINWMCLMYEVCHCLKTHMFLQVSTK